MGVSIGMIEGSLDVVRPQRDYFFIFGFWTITGGGWTTCPGGGGGIF